MAAACAFEAVSVSQRLLRPVSTAAMRIAAGPDTYQLTADFDIRTSVLAALVAVCTMHAACLVLNSLLAQAAVALYSASVSAITFAVSSGKAWPAMVCAVSSMYPPGVLWAMPGKMRTWMTPPRWAAFQSDVATIGQRPG